MNFVSKNMFWILFLLIFDAIDSSIYCPTLSLSHGRIRYLNRGRKAKFTCYRPYTLIGDTKLDCVGGEWDGALPFCAKKDCEKFPKVLHGKTTYYYDGAIASTSCDEGFSLNGSPYMYCGGKGWNDTNPECQANSISQFHMCHFEPYETKQCSWISKPAFFNWTILSSSLHESIHMTTDIYPKYDHTMAPHSGGHFLYLETLISPSVVSQEMMKTRTNVIARYISPLFPPIPEKSEEHCLIFYFYSNGPHPGNVTALIKDNATHDEMIWENDRSLGDEWHKVRITLQYQPRPFRIIIEGIGQLGFITNTAIDDLKMAQGQECSNNDVHTEKTTEFSAETTTANWSESTTANLLESHTTIETTLYTENEQNPSSDISNQLKTERSRTTVSNLPTKTSSNSSENIESNSFEIHKTYATNNESKSKGGATTMKMISRESITTPSKSFKHNTTESSPTMEIVITESNVIYNEQNPTNNNTDDPAITLIEKTLQSMKNIDESSHQRVHTTILSLNDTNNITPELHPNITENDSLTNRKTATEENHSMNSSTFLTIQMSNDPVVESNNSIYKYNHHEENEQNETHEEGNYGHFKNAATTLENKQDHEKHDSNYSFIDEKHEENVAGAKETQTKSEDHLLGVFFFIVASAGIFLLIFVLISVAILKKYGKFSDKSKDESAIQFFNKSDASVDGATFRRDEVMMMNCVPHNV